MRLRLYRDELQMATAANGGEGLCLACERAFCIAFETQDQPFQSER